LWKHNKEISGALNKLASGLKINHAKDDAAGLSISQSLLSSINGIDAASRNVSDGMSMINTADGALSVINDNLQEIRSLTVQASNGTMSDNERAAIQAEIDQRLTTISDVADNTEFNGINLLDGSAGTINIQSGEGATGSTTAVNVGGDFSSNAAAAAGTINAGNTGGAAGVALNNIDVNTGANYDNILKGIDNAIANVNTRRSSLGATYNSLESRLDNLSVSKESLMAANSRIVDTDYGATSSNLVSVLTSQKFTASLMAQNLNSAKKTSFTF
jgi:flagellin